MLRTLIHAVLLLQLENENGTLTYAEVSAQA